MPKPQPDPLEEEREGKCNYVKTDGYRCKNPAGRGTDHPGIGRCRQHGGVGRPIIHGKYSQTLEYRKDWQEKYQEFREADIQKLEDEIARARVMALQIEEHIASNFEDVETFLSLSNVMLKTLDAITKMSERANKIMFGERHVLDIQTVQVISHQVVDIMLPICQDCPKLMQVADALEAGQGEMLQGGETWKMLPEALVQS